jgi:hypothetical protein
LQEFAEIDPQTAFDVARRFGDEKLEEFLQHRLFEKKGETNMAEAWSEIDRINDGDRQALLRGSAIRGLANKDKAAALTYAEQLADPEQRESQIRFIFGDWPLSDVEEATAAFLKYSAEALVDGVAFDFGQTMNLAGSQEALDFSTSLKGEVRDDYLLGVLTEQAIKQSSNWPRPQRSSRTIFRTKSFLGKSTSVWVNLGRAKMSMRPLSG